MTRSELIDRLAQQLPDHSPHDVELAVKTILEHLSEHLGSGGRVEVRGFGSFTLHYRPGRVARNPKTGELVAVPAKHSLHFKPGKGLRESVAGGASDGSIPTDSVRPRRADRDST